jgi:hypothetical protein
VLEGLALIVLADVVDADWLRRGWLAMAGYQSPILLVFSGA